ncbi:MAG: nitroreductase family deazaflavin-dependent oxidoreductase [Actinomycetota bacterium]
MARTYKMTLGKRMTNSVFARRARRGRGQEFTYVLTTRGRTSGEPRSHPVDVMAKDGQRWLVAPYGETNWVKNVRAAGEATISRAGRDERVRLKELADDERVPVLRLYLERVKFVRPYFDETSASSDEELRAIAPSRPVFRIDPA